MFKIAKLKKRVFKQTRGEIVDELEIEYGPTTKFVGKSGYFAGFQGSTDNKKADAFEIYSTLTERGGSEYLPNAIASYAIFCVLREYRPSGVLEDTVDEILSKMDPWCEDFVEALNLREKLADEFAVVEKNLDDLLEIEQQLGETGEILGKTIGPEKCVEFVGKQVDAVRKYLDTDKATRAHLLRYCDRLE